MNYKEAIEALRLEGGLEIEGNLEKVAKFFDGLDTAIKALKEIQEYKKLGTLEEVREKVEKQKSKKIEVWNGQASCPTCHKLFGNMADINKLVCWNMTYCKWCGQHIDWRK